MASKSANNVIKTVFSQFRKRFVQSSATLSSPSPSSSFTVEFLVKECFLPPKSALSVADKFQLDERNPQKPRSVLRFLKSYHFSDIQVAELIVKHPRILHFKVASNLQPKFDFYSENGFAGELLPKLIVSNPIAIRTSLHRQVKPLFELLRSFLHCDEKIATALMRPQWLLNDNLNRVVRSNVDFLIKEGVPSISIGRLMLLGGRRSLAPKTLICAVNVVKNLGIEPDAPVFINALRAVLALSKSTWNKKIEFMKSIGWSENDILKAFKRFPNVINYSEAKIRNALHFYLNTMKLERETVVVNPVLLGFSIEKRVRPRYNVLRILESKKLNESKLRPLFISEKDFLEEYVDQYRTELPGLLEVYLGSKKSKKIEA